MFLDHRPKPDGLRAQKISKTRYPADRKADPLTESITRWRAFWNAELKRNPTCRQSSAGITQETGQ